MIDEYARKTAEANAHGVAGVGVFVVDLARGLARQPKFDIDGLINYLKDRAPSADASNSLSQTYLSLRDILLEDLNKLKLQQSSK